MAEGISYRIRIEGVRETLAAFRRLPPDATRELRQASLRIADTLAQRVRAAAAADSGQSALMVPTIKAVKDRVPAIQAGSGARVGRNRKPAHKILFGSEFGATVLRQYRPHLGAGSYWFFRTVEANEMTVAREWEQAADEIVRTWGGA